MSQTSVVRAEVEEILRGTDGIKDLVLIDGYNLLSSTLDSSAGAGFVSLAHWSERTAPGMDADSIIKKVNGQSATISNANVVAFNLPGIPGIGTVGGFDFRLQDYLSG